jgi:flagellar protein FliS
MLFDRLLLDVDRGHAALEQGDVLGGRSHLQHAQDIVAELMASLDAASWEGGPGLMAVYAYLYSTLVEAGVQGDAGKVLECRSIVEPLATTWHEAAALAAAAAPAAPAPAAAGLLGVG